MTSLSPIIELSGRSSHHLYLVWVSYLTGVSFCLGQEIHPPIPLALPLSHQWVVREVGPRPILKIDGRTSSDKPYWVIKRQVETQSIELWPPSWAFSDYVSSLLSLVSSLLLYFHSVHIYFGLILLHLFHNPCFFFSHNIFFRPTQRNSHICDQK